MIFIDTNFFLRFLLEDINVQHKKAKNLFLEAAAGKIDLFTSVVVFFEIYWVLTGFYGKKREKTAKFLEEILNMNFLRIEERDILIQAVSIYKGKKFDLEDCFNLVYAKARRAKEFRTFDIKLNREFLKT